MVLSVKNENPDLSTKVQDILIFMLDSKVHCVAQCFTVSN